MTVNNLSPSTDDVQAAAQGVTDEAAQSVVQPEGQGQEDSTSSGLYDLSGVPDNAREWATTWAKEQDARVSKKFQEAADYRKQWEPYEAAGLNSADPESVAVAMELITHLSDESTAQQAVIELCRMVGLEVEDDDFEEPGEVDPMDALREELRQEFAPMREVAEKAAQQEAYEARLSELEQEWSEVETAHGKAFSDAEKTRLISLAERFGGETPLKTAYEVYNEIAGQTEQELVTAKTREPRPAEKAGRAVTAAKPIDSFEDAERIFTERRSLTSAN